MHVVRWTTKKRTILDNKSRSKIVLTMEFEIVKLTVHLRSLYLIFLIIFKTASVL